MIPGVSGSLLSQDALARVVPRSLQGRLGESGRPAALRRLRAQLRVVQSELDPAASARTVFDRVAMPLAV